MTTIHAPPLPNFRWLQSDSLGFVSRTEAGRRKFHSTLKISLDWNMIQANCSKLCSFWLKPVVIHRSRTSSATEQRPFLHQILHQRSKWTSLVAFCGLMCFVVYLWIAERTIPTKSKATIWPKSEQKQTIFTARLKMLLFTGSHLWFSLSIYSPFPAFPALSTHSSSTSLLFPPPYFVRYDASLCQQDCNRSKCRVTQIGVMSDQHCTLCVSWDRLLAGF